MFITFDNGVFISYRIRISRVGTKYYMCVYIPMLLTRRNKIFINLSVQEMFDLKKTYIENILQLQSPRPLKLTTLDLLQKLPRS